jgi:putative transposase
MTLFKKEFRVESARRVGWDYKSRGWYFVTICTKDKKCSLGTVSGGKIVLSNAGAIAEAEMRNLAEHYTNVAVDRFVIMPNHVHAIIVIDGEHAYSPAKISGDAGDGASPVSTKTLGEIVGGYKAGVSRLCRALGIMDFAWQERFHDHILRSNAAVNGVRDYIEQNPANWIHDPDYPTMADGRSMH